MAYGRVAWARRSLAALVAVGREKPATLQGISVVQGGPLLVTHQFDGRPLGTGVVQVGDGNT